VRFSRLASAVVCSAESPAEILPRAVAPL
jgi:hypothetical protein